MKTRTCLTALLVSLTLGPTPVRAELGDLLQTFLNPTPANSDKFGFSVAALGDDVLIGARNDDTVGVDAGAAYLFDGETAELLRSFYPNPAWEGFTNRFGLRVAALGENALVGARYDNLGAQVAGVAYLPDPQTGTMVRPFQIPRPQSDSSFNFSIAAMGNDVLRGDPDYDRGAVPNAGAVYLFDGTTGDLLHTFENPTPKQNDLFGYSVAAVDNKVLIGGPRDDTRGRDAGAVYLFDGESGDLLHTFFSPNPVEPGAFGWSVAAVADKLLIGAHREDSASVEGAGAAYLFDGTTGQLLHTFLNPTPAESDRFGLSVAALGDDVLISAIGDDTGATDAGAVYLFDEETGGLLHTFLNPTPEPAKYFGADLAALDNNVLISSFQSIRGASQAGAVYLFEGPVVPEPSTLLSLISLGACGLLAYGWRRRKQHGQ